MLNYKNTIFFFIILLIVIICADIIFSVSFVFYVIPFFILISLLAYGSASIQSQFYIRSFCCAETKNKHIALSFDDGPDEFVTPRLLELLKNYQIKAAFFCIGEKAEKLPELIKQIDLEGHIIGSHSYTHHYWFDLFSAQHMEEDLRKTDAAIKKIINKKINWFRPPYGVTNPPLAKVINRMQYFVIGWSLKSKDTTISNRQKLMNRLINNFKPGDIILFHDNQPHIIEVLDNFIKFAIEKKYTFIRPDQLLNIEAYE